MLRRFVSVPSVWLLFCVVSFPVLSSSQGNAIHIDSVPTIQQEDAAITSALSYEPLMDENEELSFQDALVGTFSRALLQNQQVLHDFLQQQQDDALQHETFFSLRRHLAIGDFEELNELFKGVVIRLPDADVSRKLGFWRLKLDISELLCTNMQVGDILISYQRVNSQNLTITLDVIDLDMNCNMDYDYDYGPFNGDGEAKAKTNNNDASVTLKFTSPQGFDVSPPTLTSIDNCEANINVDKIDFDGGFVASILDVFESLIGNVVEREVEDVACDELGSLGTTFITKFLELADEILQEYLGPLAAAEPLAAETAMVAAMPETMNLLDFQDTENTIVKFFDTILQELDALLGTVVTEEDGPTESGKDLGVNVFLRKYILDQDRALTLDVASVFPNGTTLFDGHDKLTQTTIELNTVRLFGLDTFTKFEPLLDIGRFTLSNELAWDFFNVELDVTITIRPSTLEDSVIEQPTADKVVETVRIEFGVDMVDTVVSLLLAIDQDALGGLRLGQVLDTSALLPCLLSTVYKVELSQLTVSLGGVRTPTLEDFVSPGIDRVVSTAVDALFDMYEAVVLQAMPNIFELKVLDIINENLIKNYTENPENTKCVTPQVNDTGFIDFRDLLLEPETALTAGGTGTSPYGDVAFTLMSLLQEQFLALDDNGMPKLNSMLIGPLTESQSGQPGMLRFPSDLFSITREVDDMVWSSFTEHFRLKMFDTRIDNLDILTEPVSLLQPTTDPHILTNMLNIGPVSGRPLNGTVRLLLALDGDESPLSMYNEMDISVAVPSSVLWADILATIDTERLLSFPLRDVLNYNCWLATIPAPELDENGNYLEPGGDPSLALSRFFVQLLDLDVGVDCTNCTSPGVAILPDLIASLKQSGAVPMLRDRLESVLAELVEGDWLQLIVDRLLSDASKLCPHSSGFVEGAFATDYGSLGFPNLSRESIETIAFAGATAAPVAVFVMAESQMMTPVEPTDPLSGQASLVVPASSRLVDFTDLGGTVGSWAENLLEQARDLVSDAIGNNSSTTRSGNDAFDLRALVRDLLLDDEGVLRIPFSGLVIDEAGMSLSLTEIRITGLDSITNLNILDPIGPQTLQNSLKLDELGVEVVIEISVDGSIPEEMTLSFGVNNVELNLALLIPLDLDRLGTLELGSMLHIQQIFPCLLSTLWDVDISQFLVTVGSIEVPSISGFLPDSLLNTVSVSIQTLFDSRGSTLVAAMPRLSDVVVRGLLNGILKGYVNADENTVCPLASAASDLDDFMDFRDLLLPQDKSRELGGSGDNPYGDLPRVALEFVKDLTLEIDPTDGTSSLNDLLIRPWTEGQSNEAGTIAIEGDLFNQDVKLGVGGLNALIELRGYNARIENLDTLGEPLELLQPVMNEASILNNTATFGRSNPLRFSITLVLALTGDDDMQLRNEVDISIDLESASVVLGALLKIAEEPFLSFPLRDVTKIDCWLATIPAPPLDARGVRAADVDPTAALVDLAVSMARLGLNISCVSCTSPDLEELADILSSPEAREDATEVGNMVVDYVTNLLGGNFLQIQIDRLLNDAARKCPHNPAFDASAVQVQYEPFEDSERDDNSVAFLIAIVVAMGCLFAASVVTYLAVRCIVRRRHRAWLRSLASEHIVALYREQKREADINKDTKSMFTSPVIPIYVRLSIPVVILGNIGFFLSGHLSLGATVNIEANLFGEAFTVEKFFEFSMAQSTVDIWNAGGKELAVLILIFSGIWPYTKQLISLVLWFLPPRILSVTRRGTVFYWLDALAKWSMVDIFALVISIASFRVSIESPDVAFLTESFYSLDLMVVPLWGLYANMIAQLISQVSSHFIIHYHRRIVIEASNQYDHHHSSPETVMTEDNESYPSGSEIESGSSEVHVTEEIETERQDQLCQHAFVRPHRGDSDKLLVRRGINAVLVMTSIAVVFLVIFGCSRPSFSIEVLGIIGVAVESGQQFKDAVTDYSVFSIVGLLMEEARFLDSAGDYIGLGVLSVLVILSVLVVPLVQTLALLRHWFTPMSRQRRSKLVVLVEILQAWQYIEVYLIAVIVSAWQLGPVSDFMINSYCDDLEATFATLVFYGIIEPRDAQCFMVEASVENATYMLIAAAILLAVLNTFIMKAAEQYHRDTDTTLLRFEVEDPKLRDSSSSMHSDDDIFAIMEKIHPVPVMFTDIFRWVLRREDSFVSQSMRKGLDRDAMLGVDDGFPDVVPKVESGVPVILAYPEKCSGSDAASDDQSGNASNNLFATNGTPAEEKMFREDDVQPRAVAFAEKEEFNDDDMLPVDPPAKTMSKRISIFRSFFSFRSNSTSTLDAAAWQCSACSHTNGDGKNLTCAVCGTKRDSSDAAASVSTDCYLTSPHENDEALNTEPSKKRGLSSIRSLFSLRSVESSHADESEWKCYSCSYSNVDGRSKTCALCGVPRAEVAGTAPAHQDAESSIISGAPPSLMTIEEESQSDTP